MKVYRGAADEHPRVVRRVKAGETGKVHAGEWVIEQPHVIHFGANEGDANSRDPARHAVQERQPGRDTGGRVSPPPACGGGFTCSSNVGIDPWAVGWPRRSVSVVT